MAFWNKEKTVAASRSEPTLVTKDATITTAGSNPGLWNALGGFLSDTGVPVTFQTSLNHSTVYACVKRKADDIGKTPLKMGIGNPRDGYEETYTDPLIVLLNNPNDFQTPFDFWKFISSCIDLRGNAYIYVQRNSSGEPIRLTPILPDRCQVSVSPNGNIFYNVSHPTLGQGKSFNVTSDNLIHIRGGLSLDGGIMGVTPITLCQNALGNALAVQKHSNTLFKRGATPQFAISYPAGTDLGNDGVKNLRKAVEGAYGGSDNAHGVLILDGGATTAPLEMTAADAQLLETKRFNVEEICRLFGVNPIQVFALDKATFNNVEQMDAAYTTGTMIPMATNFAQCLMKGLVVPEQRPFVKLWFDVDAAIYIDTKTKAESISLLRTAGILTRNDALQALGRPKDRNDPDGDKPIIPAYAAKPNDNGTNAHNAAANAGANADPEKGTE